MHFPCSCATSNFFRILKPWYPNQNQPLGYRRIILGALLSLPANLWFLEIVSVSARLKHDVAFLRCNFPPLGDLKNILRTFVMFLFPGMWGNPISPFSPTLYWYLLRPLLTPMICFLALCSIKNYFHLTWMVACCCFFFTNDFFKGSFYFLHRLFRVSFIVLFPSCFYNFASHHHICL
jgi:hypothetical protein